MTTPTTVSTAAAELSSARRAGLAGGSRRNAETEAESPREARFWIALADTLDNPGQSADGQLRAAAGDLDSPSRRILASVLCRSRDLVAQTDPALAEFWSETMCVLLEAETEGKRIARESSLLLRSAGLSEPPC